MNEENKELQQYSVLMSVYYKEKPAYLKKSMLSIYHQTHPTNDFVLICDGPLTPELDKVIDEMQQLFGDILKVNRLSQNSGLGNALNYGLGLCKNSIVVRMDSDDISRKNRCELQIRYFEEHPETDLLSGTLLEFQGSAKNIVGKRELPATHDEICSYSRKRNPFNHPAVAFRKKAVEEAGNYQETYHLFEDYYLWIRMLRKGCIGHNLKEPILYMRTSPDIYMRRGGFNYAFDLIRFHMWIRSIGWSSRMDFLSGAIPHAVICVSPGFIRRLVYRVLHRQNER